MKFRRAELIFTAFFLYAMLIAALRPIAPEMKLLIFTLNPAVILWFCLFAWTQRHGNSVILDRVRDWYPVPLILLAFREMGWMALPHTSRAFENYWLVWDQRLLNEWGLKTFIESVGPLLPNLLELSYLLVYVMPIVTVAVFYLNGVRERLDDVYTILLVGTLSAYAMYPFFPSEPPRTVYPLTDLPMMSALRQLNLFFVGNYGIHTSVFPSGHSAAAFSAAFAVIKLLPESRWLGRTFLVLAVLIGIATIYGRYHFAIDAVAGLALAALSVGLSELWRLRSNPSPQ